VLDACPAATNAPDRRSPAVELATVDRPQLIPCVRNGRLCSEGHNLRFIAATSQVWSSASNATRI
jgi:hypothetical protein